MANFCRSYARQLPRMHHISTDFYCKAPSGPSVHDRPVKASYFRARNITIGIHVIVLDEWKWPAL